MMKLAVLVLLTLTTAACYRATVDTGLTPSGETVENSWAHAFIGGLIPPATVETAARCPAGVARVTTELSFLNALANAVTWGLYSPMTIKVACAAGAGEDIDTAAAIDATRRAPEEGLTEAAIRSWEQGGAPVVVRLAR